MNGSEPPSTPEWVLEQLRRTSDEIVRLRRSTPKSYALNVKLQKAIKRRDALRAQLPKPRLLVPAE